ncbi:hypothetical protein ACFFV7_38945 [Nonomuraea spiralis]|uniref:Uncharacterized protein n=1 Tax=Nonomuraea spiralis TaxID=46182 RepID=A0ABV5ITB3_9ACTN|nr:hypothetical protein [Nonomuraea spiralis]GGT42871.1 hypothetical protein GCM10010176_103010 [Nonomuraea spiralis]
MDLPKGHELEWERMAGTKLRNRPASRPPRAGDAGRAGAGHGHDEGLRVPPRLGGELSFAKGKIWPHPEFEAWQWKRTGAWHAYAVAAGVKLYVNILAGQAQPKQVTYTCLDRPVSPCLT